MMSFENFVEYVKGSIQHYLPSEFERCKVHVTEVNKNNNLHFTSISIVDSDLNMSPPIYLEKFFSKYESGDYELDECIKNIAEAYLRNLISEDKISDIKHFMSYENAHDKIMPRLVSAENNDTFLDEIPHHIMDGLAVTYYLPISEFDEDDCKASVCVRYGLMKEWGVTEEELYAASVANLMRNVETKFLSIRDVLLESISDAGEDIDAQWVSEYLPPEDEGMYILTNCEKFYGAAMLLNHNVMDDIVERIGECYILPSSVHEVILLKKETGQSLEYLEAMVREVNQTEVSANEKLSDRVFLYDAKTKEIYRADHEEEHRKQVSETSRDGEELARTTPTPHMRRGR